MVGFLVANAMCGSAAVAAVRVAYIPNARNHAGWHAVFWRDEDVPGCAGNVTSGDNVRQQTTMRPFCQTMRHCCQLIPLQITPPFIVSSLALSFFHSLSPSPSLFLFPPLARSLFHSASQSRCCLLSHSWVLVINSVVPLFSSIFPRTLYLSSLSICPPSRSLLFLGPFPLPFALSSSHVLFLFRFHFTLLTLPLPTLRRPPHGRSFSVVKGCTWDRGDKRNYANKYAPADNCTINRSWLVKRGCLNALTCSVNVLWISFHETITASLDDTIGRSCALVSIPYSSLSLVLVFFTMPQNIVSTRN